MSKSTNSIDRLKSAYGLRVKRVCAEVYFYANESHGDIFMVGIEIENNINIKFGCAGDGGILVAKGLCNDSRPSGNEVIRVRDIGQLSNSVLKKVDNNNCSINIYFSNGILKIENIDDRLIATYNEVVLNNDALVCRKVF